MGMMLRLEGYRFGRLVIDGNEETRDVIPVARGGRYQLVARERTDSF
jgi:hypothetical protein